MPDNKQRYSIQEEGVQLSTTELASISQFYARKDVHIYVRHHLPAYVTTSSHPKTQGVHYSNTTTEQAFNIMFQLQDRLDHEGIIGYLHTPLHLEQGHTECFVITKELIIKPIEWWSLNSEKVVSINTHQQTASASLLHIFNSLLIPQADAISCATIGMAYLKTLLKNNGQQLKELCMLVPLEERFKYFFVPSPELLSYSQSNAYNKYMYHFVLDDEPGQFHHKSDYIEFTTLKKHLEKIAQHSSNADEPLEVLPEFRTRWCASYQRMDQKRLLMENNPYNWTLSYTSKRMKRIAQIEQQQKTNPGRHLFTTMEQNLNNESLILSEEIESVAFHDATELGYFMHRLALLIPPSRAFKSCLNSKNLQLINTPLKYRACTLLLTQTQRDLFKSHLLEPHHFVALIQAGDESAYTLFAWIRTFEVPEHEKLKFLTECFDRAAIEEILIKQLTNFFIWDNCFIERVTAVALMEWIGYTSLIDVLPQIHNSRAIKQLNYFFTTDEHFYAFIRQHYSLERVLELTPRRSTYSPTLMRTPKTIHCSYIEDYLQCMGQQTYMPLLHSVLSDPNSLLRTLIEQTLHPAIVFFNLVVTTNWQQENTILNKLCSTHKKVLVELSLQQISPWPPREASAYRHMQSKVNFLEITPETITLYRDKIGVCTSPSQLLLLREILSYIKQEERLPFINTLFADSNIEEKNRILAEPQIASLFLCRKSVIPPICFKIEDEPNPKVRSY